MRKLLLATVLLAGSAHAQQTCICNPLCTCPGAAPGTMYGPPLAAPIYPSYGGAPVVQQQQRTIPDFNTDGSAASLVKPMFDGWNQTVNNINAERQYRKMLEIQQEYPQTQRLIIQHR